MLNLFKNKKAGPKVIDTIWMTHEAKCKGIMERWQKDHNVIILCWFDATLQELQSRFERETGAGESLLMASHTHESQLSGKAIIFAEHYPLRSKEEAYFQKLDRPELIIHSALDEPLFSHFGGEKIIEMMKQLGMKETESVQHKLISQSIANAQEKIARKVTNEHLAQSQKEWMERNLID